MKRLLSFELRKLLRLKSFYICGSLTFALAFLNIYLCKDIYDGLNGGFNPNFTGKAMLLESVNNSNFTLLMSVFVVLYACNDFDNQTAKNIYAKGFSKTKIYFVKWLVVFAVITATFLLSVLFSWGVGTAFFGSEAESGNYLGLMLAQYLVCVAYAAFSFFIAFSFKRVGASVALAILGTLIITLALSFIDAFAEWEKIRLGNYWLDSFLLDLCLLGTSAKRIAICAGLSVAYAGVFLGGGCYLYNLRDE